MRPLLEYAAIVWDSCTNYEKDSLEKIQYEAARVVTGLTRSVSIFNLLQEIGWVSLNDRRKIQKLAIIYKVKSGVLPDYLQNLFPPIVADTNRYNLRNSNDFVTIARRTEIYSKSFIPSSTKLWNELSEEIKGSTSLSIFKSKLKELFKPPTVPEFFFIGDRTYAIYHARIRNHCSNLNGDLFTNHLSESATCQCGHHIEDAEHFFFNCPAFNLQRHQFFTATREYHPLSTNTLLFGNESLSVNDNVALFAEIHKYIKLTERFNN